MKQMKKLATSKDIDLRVIPPFDSDVLKERDIYYQELSDINFSKKYRSYLYAPTHLKIYDESIEIQLNKCSNPFCGRYGQPQKKFDTI